MESKPSLGQLRAPVKSDGKILAVGLVFAFVILAFDFFMPLGVAAGVPYVVLVLLCLWAKNSFCSYLMATVGTVFTIVGYSFSPEGGIHWVVLSNRGLAIFAIWAVALLSVKKHHETGMRKAAEETRLAAEKGLSASEARYRSIIDTANEGFWRIDENLRIIDVNDAICRMLGYPREEILGKRPFDFADDTETLNLKALIEKDMRGGREAMSWGCRFVRKDGSPLDAQVSATNFVDRDGSTTGSFAFITDVTEQKERDAQLRQAQKMDAVGQLTGGIAHEFNNLLMVVFGNIEAIGSRLAKDDPLQSFASSAMKGALRGAELTQSLLAFSRKQRLKSAQVDINELVTGMSNLFRRTLGETITVEADLAEDVWRTSADAGQTETALLNFVLNACDAMPGGGTITVRTSNRRITADKADHYACAELGEYVSLEVSDTGRGMTQEEIGHAVEPFYTTKEVGEGAGLGLSVAYGFAKQSGGCLEIESKPGRGTTVRLCLPRAAVEAAVAEREQEMPVEAVTGSGKILVVEDDAEVRQLVRDQLVELGYTVVEAEDGPAALSLLDEQADIDLLFSDVVLPGGISGPDTAIMARRKRPDLKVLLTSGFPKNDVRHLELSGNGTAILRKPYRKFELATAIAATMIA